MLQHPARRKPATNAQIDLAKLAYWDGLTRPTNRVFNGVFDSKTSLYDALMRVARLGRAVMTLRDLKYSVVIDEPKTVPVRMFSPRNSWGYEGEMSVEPSPHGYRLSYVNAAENSKTDELVVYDDGYGFANATLIDKVEILGINNYTQAFKEGRYHIAQQRLRREVHRIQTDFEHLACERGDLVALQHDVIAVGLANGRIVARTENATHVFDVTLDNAVTMEAGKLYGIRARRIYGGAMRTDLYRVNTIAGESPRLYFAAPPVLNDAPAVGDLVSFGIYDRETLRVLIRDIEPQQDLTAKLTLIAEAPGVHVAEFGTIPAYDPMVTAPLALPAPVVIDIRSDERAMIVTPSRELIDRVFFELQPISIGGASLYVLYRISATNAGWQVATIQEETTSSVAIVGLPSGETYDFQLRYTHPNYLSSPATTIISHYVAGRTTAPAVLRNLSLAIVGGQALLMWALPVEIDVQYGGWVMFRHSPDMDATLWPNSTSLAQAVVGEQTHVYMPLKPGTYFARTYDADGRASTNFAYVSTKQANLLAFSPVGEIVEDPLFTGYKFNCKLVSDYLTLTADTFDNITDVALLAAWGVSGGSVEAGQYNLSVGMDLGSVKRCRVTSHVNVEAINENDYWDAKIGNIDSWPDIDGTLGAVVDAHVWGQVSDSAHGSVSWWNPTIPMQRIDAMEINARSMGALHVRMVSEDAAFNLRVTELRLTADEVA